MGTYVNNGIVLIPNEHKFGEAPDILSELGGLLGVGKRSDGRYHHADVNQADGINKWAARKSIPTTMSSYAAVTHNLYTTTRTYFNNYTGNSMTRIGDIGNVEIVGREGITDVSFATAMGIDIPFIAQVSADNSNSLNSIVNVVTKIASDTSGYNWEKSLWSRRSNFHNRIRDFDGYNHTAGFPFKYALNESTVYRDQDLGISIEHVSSNDNLSPATLFQYAFGDYCYGAAVVKDPANGLSLVTGTYKLSAAKGGLTIPSETFRDYPNKTFTAYLFAHDTTKGNAVLLPKESPNSPVVSFKVSQYVSTDPFEKLNMLKVTDSSNNDRVGYNTGTANTFLLKKCTPVMGTAGTLYAVATSGSMVFSMTWKNNTSSEVTIKTTYFRFNVATGYGNTTTVIHTPTVYDSSFTQKSGDIKVAAGATVQLYFKIGNVWNGQNLSTSNTTVHTLNVTLQYNEPIYVNYGGFPTYPNLYSVGIAAVYSTAYNGQVAKVTYDGYNSLVINSWTSYANVV